MTATRPATAPAAGLSRKLFRRCAIVCAALLTAGFAAFWILQRTDAIDVRVVPASTVLKAPNDKSQTAFHIAASVDELAWSPDSQSVLVLARSKERQRPQVEVLRLDPAAGTNTTLLQSRDILFGLSELPVNRDVCVCRWRTGSEGQGELLVLDGKSGALTKRLPGMPLTELSVPFTSDPLCLAVGPDGGFVAAGCKLVDKGTLHGAHIGGCVCVWNLAKNSVEWENRTTHTDIVYAVAFSPDGAQLASAGQDKLIRLWDARTGQLRRTLVGAAWDGITSIAFSNDGKLLASGGQGAEDGGRVLIWDLESEKLLHRIPAFRERSSVRVAIAPDGRLFATGLQRNSDQNEFKVHVWQARTGAHTGVLTEGKGAPRAVSLSPNGKLLAVGTYEGDVVVLDVK